MIADWQEAADGAAEGSPHVYAGGTGVHNPGVTMHWEGPKPGGRPVIDAVDDAAIDAILQRAARE